MSKRADLRQITKQVEEALADYDVEQLRAMLTHVFREYVVEGQPAYLVHQTEQIDDLAGLSFAELITTLQTRLPLPELAQFKVEAARVQVRVGGVWQSVDAQDESAAEPEPPASPAPEPVAAPTDAPAASATSAGASEASANPPQEEPKPPPTQERPAAGDDDASQRFSLLELD